MRVSPYLHQITREGRLEYLPGIKEFISFIDNAELLITDSFHGTAFAINLGTPFVEVLPDNGTASRNASILRLTGLEGRVLGSVDDLSLALEPIDFSQVNEVLDRERKQSLEVLRSSIEGGER